MGIVAAVDFLGRKGGPVPFWEGCGPGKGGARLRGGMVGAGSVDLGFAASLPSPDPEDVDTGVREEVEVWEVVRLSGREIKGCEIE